MSRLLRRPLGGLFLCCVLPCLPTAAHADDGSETLGLGYWRATVSPFSLHFTPSPEHEYVWAMGVERQRLDDWLAGGSFFSNSFGQPSIYVYVGKRFPGLFGKEQLFGQLSGGLMYGYVGQYEDKVPLNYKGFSPGALISMGWQFDQNTSATLHLLGNSGLMIQLAYDWR